MCCEKVNTMRCFQFPKKSYARDCCSLGCSLLGAVCPASVDQSRICTLHPIKRPYAPHTLNHTRYSWYQDQSNPAHVGGGGLPARPGVQSAVVRDGVGERGIAQVGAHILIKRPKGGAGRAVAHRTPIQRSHRCEPAAAQRQDLKGARHLCALDRRDCASAEDAARDELRSERLHTTPCGRCENGVGLPTRRRLGVFQSIHQGTAGGQSGGGGVN